jgi:isopenicillin N synthase-like dioxygenase
MSINIDGCMENSITTFPKSEICDGSLCFQSEIDYQNALKEGVFFVKIPKDIDVKPGIKFCENFYKKKDNGIDKEYKGFNQLSYNDSILGYSDRHDQVEQVQLEIPLWNKYFPQELSNLLFMMNKLGLLIVENIFEKVGITKKYWDVITGGASKSTALQYCIFNHYRSLKNRIGITKHKDSGFITVLYSPEPGLEALTDERWVSIYPEDGYFTINLGHSFEVLTGKQNLSIKAVEHRVKEIKKSSNEPDRYSFGTYIGPRFDMNLFQYDNGKLVFYKTFIEFQKIKAKEMGYEFHPKVKVP